MLPDALNHFQRWFLHPQAINKASILLPKNMAQIWFFKNGFSVFWCYCPRCNNIILCTIFKGFAQLFWKACPKEPANSCAVIISRDHRYIDRRCKGRSVRNPVLHPRTDKARWSGVKPSSEKMRSNRAVDGSPENGLAVGPSSEQKR